ncbi:MAG: glycogen debranching protein GlgX [Rhodoferax sp.]|nr:glycogen debranching protein GlgX [Rhodoferax sp.]
MNPAGAPASALSCEPGQAWPMGASAMTLQGHKGVNFAVYSRHAERMDVCLYDAQGARETARFSLPVCSNGVWHGFVAGLGVGQLYGLRAHGPYQPSRGQRFNPAKLLIDPFARALVGDTQHLSLERDYLGQPAEHATVLDALPDPVDNAPRIPKARVLDLAAELQAGAAIAPGPPLPLARTVLYEVHVKGLTQRHPDVPVALRGRYAGLASAPMLAHYQRLGITTLCLLPVQLFITEAHLLKKGLRNYWGYNTLGYFVPEPGYASGQYLDERSEFRHMVDQLHRHGLEVVLDVVYNHSAESDTFGPTLSWRGLDNASWYALDDAGQYLNFSGCGNSFNLAQPCAVQLVMDSLRWWVQAYGVDGFRFDLATALGRDPVRQHHFHPVSELLTAIGQDPVLAKVKLIAEPWDVGPHGYQLGQFPAGWLEWNDRFRDTSRAFWLGFDCTRGVFARRLTGSSDYFDRDGRSPLSSVNLVTAHDGMTLADATSYRHKHNLPNGEDNRDGHHHNLSDNAGVEGPTQDEVVQAVRGQWRRALLATLFCSQGMPQLLAGDELGHSQSGNNNAYCQDNETTWLDWSDTDASLIDFVAGLIHLRHAHAALRHARWFTPTDIRWRNPDGSALTTADWDDPLFRSFACQIEVADEGLALTERWLLLFHAGSAAMPFSLPPGRWLQVLDSAAARVLPQAQWGAARPCVDDIMLSPRSVFGLVQTDTP